MGAENNQKPWSEVNQNDSFFNHQTGESEGSEVEPNGGVGGGGTDGGDSTGETKEDSTVELVEKTKEEPSEETKGDSTEEHKKESTEDKIAEFKELYLTIEKNTTIEKKLEELKHEFIRIYDEKIKTKEFQEDIKADRDRIKIAKKLYDFWTDKLDVLGDKYINDLLYYYKDEILDEFEGVETGKKSIVIAIENNPQKNKEILSITLKELLDKVGVMTKNSDIMSVKRVREDSGVLYLNPTDLGGSEVQSLNGTLKSLLMIHKNLKTEKDGILFIDNQINNTIKQLYIPMMIESVTLDLIILRVKQILISEMPSDDKIASLVENQDVAEELVVNTILNKEIVELLKDDVDEFIKDILTSDNLTSKSILDGINKFQKSMVKFFNLSVIKAYNNIATTRKNFNREHKGKPYLEKWNDLFIELESYLLNFLKEFGITKIITERTDDYNPEIHLPIAEAEKDEELKNDQIKSVENEGFQFSNRLIFKDAETSNHILKQAEVIVVRNN